MQCTAKLGNLCSGSFASEPSSHLLNSKTVEFSAVTDGVPGNTGNHPQHLPHLFWRINNELNIASHREKLNKRRNIGKQRRSNRSQLKFKFKSEKKDFDNF